MDIKLEPLPGRIVLQMDVFNYSGRIIVPENARRLPSTGHVIAVGEGVTAVKIGDQVVVPMYSGTGLSMRDKKTQQNHAPMRVVTAEEILVKLLEDTAELVDTTA